MPTSNLDIIVLMGGGGLSGPISKMAAIRKLYESIREGKKKNYSLN